MKYHKFPSHTIPKHVNILAKENKPFYECLLEMMPYVFTVL